MILFWRDLKRYIKIYKVLDKTNHVYVMFYVLTVHFDTKIATIFHGSVFMICPKIDHLWCVNKRSDTRPILQISLIRIYLNAPLGFFTALKYRRFLPKRADRITYGFSQRTTKPLFFNVLFPSMDIWRAGILLRHFLRLSSNMIHMNMDSIHGHDASRWWMWYHPCWQYHFEPKLVWNRHYFLVFEQKCLWTWIAEFNVHLKSYFWVSVGSLKVQCVVCDTIWKLNEATSFVISLSLFFLFCFGYTEYSLTLFRTYDECIWW